MMCTKRWNQALFTFFFCKNSFRLFDKAERIHFFFHSLSMRSEDEVSMKQKQEGNKEKKIFKFYYLYNIIFTITSSYFVLA
jgi:hypothetical protein